MKNNLLLVLLCLSVAANAQTKLIHYWNFNGSNYTSTKGGLRTSIPIAKASYSAIDTNKAYATVVPQIGAGNKYTYVDYTTGDTINMRMAAGAGNCYRYRSPSDSDALVFFMPTTGFKNIKIQFEVQNSSLTNYMNYYYSTDSGKTWKTSGISVLGDSATPVWKRSSVITFTDASVNNNKLFAFKIVNTLTAHNDRFDNVTVEGVSSTAVNEIPQAAHVTEMKMVAQNGSIYISSNAMMQQIDVYDLCGKRVATEYVNSIQANVNVSNLTHGLYIVKVYTTNGILTRKLIF